MKVLTPSYNSGRYPLKQRTGFIFCRDDGQPLNQVTVRKHLNSAMDSAGSKRSSYTHGFHIFGHTAGSMIYTKSRDLKLVQGVLGHSGIAITPDVYVHLDENAVAEGTALLTEEIFGSLQANCDPGKPDGQLKATWAKRCRAGSPFPAQQRPLAHVAVNE
jgi:hypothetical protein